MQDPSSGCLRQSLAMSNSDALQGKGVECKTIAESRAWALACNIAEMQTGFKVWALGVVGLRGVGFSQAKGTCQAWPLDLRDVGSHVGCAIPMCEANAVT